MALWSRPIKKRRYDKYILTYDWKKDKCAKPINYKEYERLPYEDKIEGESELDENEKATIDVTKPVSPRTADAAVHLYVKNNNIDLTKIWNK